VLMRGQRHSLCVRSSARSKSATTKSPRTFVYSERSARADRAARPRDRLLVVGDRLTNKGSPRLRRTPWSKLAAMDAADVGLLIPAGDLGL